MLLENILLGTRKPATKKTDTVLYLYNILRVVAIIEMESETVVVKGQRMGMGCDCLMPIETQFYRMKRVKEREGADGHTIL